MIARDPYNGSPITEFINDVLENASEFPGDLRDYSFDVNRDLIDRATRQEIEDNLRQNEIQRLASQTTSWLSKPMNLIIAFVGIVGAVLLLKR